MEIMVNGRPMVLSDAGNIAALIRQLGLEPEGVAVAVNGEVVPRSSLAERALCPGDRVEIIHAVGGG